MTWPWRKTAVSDGERQSGGAPAPEDRLTGKAGDDLFDEQFEKKLEYLAIVSRRIFSGRSRAERRSKKTGSGIEFADYRQYSPGDDYRQLDWRYTDVWEGF